jgi:hypothetical protein
VPVIVLENSQPTDEPNGTIIEIEKIQISYRLNASNLRSGVFSLPTSLKGMVSGQYFIQSSGTGSRSIISVDGDRLTGLHRPIAIRGGQSDDVVVVKFDLRHVSTN